MPSLILRNAEGQEIGRRDMAPDERYDLYQRYRDHDLLTFAHARYVLHSVAWNRQAQDCVVLVSFDSWEPTADPYGC